MKLKVCLALVVVLMIVTDSRFPMKRLKVGERESEESEEEVEERRDGERKRDEDGIVTV